MNRSLTIRQVAQICQVSTRTATKWFDNKVLKGTRLPHHSGDPEKTGDRRVYEWDLEDFMKEHDMWTDFKFTPKPDTVEQPDTSWMDAVAIRG
jgi:transposase